ncbi:GNAT family N-acetyltransferase [Georgenia wangjunii]|uniref:GNAT family N-acetyltransferase n=1 Tax=Georgenia wangjunii TaxID=3117730 RepID=UPI002F25FBEC
MTRVELREQRPEDAAAVAVLDNLAPDGGMISFGWELHVPDLQTTAGQHEHCVGVVAVLHGSGEVVGHAKLSTGRCRVGGRELPYALLGALSVHPDHRRQGIARALAQWRIDRARDRFGPDVVVVAEIQSGNAASLASARTWATQLVGRAVVAPMPMRVRPPRRDPALEVRAALPGDLPEVAARLTEFTHGMELARLHSAESLGAWLASSPLAEPVNHYAVATDTSGRLLAGMGLREEGRLRSMRVVRMPAALRAANRLLRIVPPGGVMRNVLTDKVWYAPGHGRAARYLWETTRWRMRGSGTTVVATYDPRGPLRDALSSPPWFPTTSFTLAVRSPVPLDPTRVIDPPP